MKEFKIEGNFYDMPSEMTEDDLWDELDYFFEQKGWVFGGSISTVVKEHSTEPKP